MGKAQWVVWGRHVKNLNLICGLDMHYKRESPWSEGGTLLLPGISWNWKGQAFPLGEPRRLPRAPRYVGPQLPMGGTAGEQGDSGRGGKWGASAKRKICLGCELLAATLGLPLSISYDPAFPYYSGQVPRKKMQGPCPW